MDEVEVKRIDLWRMEVANEPGALAAALGPLAEAGADLDVVMAYRFPGNEEWAAVEVYPVSGQEQEAAARRAGLEPSGIPALMIDGANKPGLGRAMAESLAETGINMAFFVAQVIGDRYVAVVGFDNESDARAAHPVLEKVAAAM